VRQNSIRIEVSDEIFKADFLNNREYSIIKISHLEGKNIRWIDKNEILLNNQLFDVVKKSETKDSIFFYCKQDIQENQLIEELVEFIEKQFDQDSNTTNNKSSIPVHKIFENFITFQDFNFSFQRLCSYSIQLVISEINFYVNSVILDLLQPPQL
jgi:hypothetical protein